jgi:hypothetical protein
MKAILENIVKEFKSQLKATEIINLIQSSSWILNTNGETIIGNLTFDYNGRLILSTISGVLEGRWEILKTNSHILINIGSVKEIWILQLYNDSSIILKKDMSTDLIILASQNKFDIFSLQNIIQSYTNSNSYNRNYEVHTLSLNPLYKYHVLSKSKILGPYDIHELKKLIKKGKLNQMCYIKRITETSFSAGLRIKDLF